MANQYNVTEADHIFLLKFIRGYVKTNGFPPTIREMTDTLGLASTCPTRGRLAVIEERGWIVRQANMSRAVRVTNKGYQAIKAHDNEVMLHWIGAQIQHGR